MPNPEHEEFGSFNNMQTLDKQCHRMTDLETFWPRWSSLIIEPDDIFNGVVHISQQFLLIADDNNIGKLRVLWNEC